MKPNLRKQARTALNFCRSSVVITPSVVEMSAIAESGSSIGSSSSNFSRSPRFPRPADTASCRFTVLEMGIDRYQSEPGRTGLLVRRLQR